MAGPLSGTRILDFTTLLPGPLATLLLAEAGAEVIKIERPGRGEEMRSYPPTWGTDGVNFALLNRGKRSLAIHLKDTGMRARLRPLIETADVLVEQFRPGVMARLELDYESVAEINPRIIYCSISGYGQTGPKRDVAGHDLNYLGDAGLLSLSMGSIDQPVVPPALIADIAGGAYPAVMNILLALRERDRTGKGCSLDVAMTENMFPLLYWALGNGRVAGAWPGNGDGLVTGGSPRYQLYPTADHRFVAAAPLEQRFWEIFVEAIGLDVALRDDALDSAATIQAVGEIIGAHPADYWEPLLKAADCCCSIVRTLEEALADPHFAARGIHDEKLVNKAGDETPALPVPIDPGLRAHPGEALPAPELGADNDELLP